MLETLNMALIRCPVGFSEDIIAVFFMKKNHELTPKLTKIPKLSIFQNVYEFFFKFSTDVVDWNVFKGHEGKN